MRAAVISRELSDFVESGISVLVGTRDARLLPECVRVVGARVERGGAELTVFVPEATGAVTIANLRDNGRIAVCFTRPRDHRSIQLKGQLVSIRGANARERRLVDAYRAGLAEELGWVGLPQRVTLRMAHWPCHAVRLKVEQVFDQTPGPGAGDPMRTREAGRP